MKQSPVEQKIEQLITPSIDDMGYDVVRVKMLSADREGGTLQIMIGNKDDRPVTCDDCTKSSHQISAILDAEDPISGRYHLEVSSPGIERPLTKPADFSRFCGKEVAVELTEAIDNRRRFKGIITKADDQQCWFSAEHASEGDICIAFDYINKARLVASF